MGRDVCGPSAAGGLPRGPSVGTDRESLCTSIQQLGGSCSPPGAQSAPAVLDGWPSQTVGPGKVPAACHGLGFAWLGRIGGWMRETRACSWAESRFGQQDKQVASCTPPSRSRWSPRRDAAQSEPSGRRPRAGRRRIRAQPREGHGCPWRLPMPGLEERLFYPFPAVERERVVMSPSAGPNACPPHAPTADERDRAQDMHPFRLQGAASEASRDRLRRPSTTTAANVVSITSAEFSLPAGLHRVKARQPGLVQAPSRCDGQTPPLPWFRSCVCECVNVRVSV